MKWAYGAALCAVLAVAPTGVFSASLEPGDYKVGFVAETTGPVAFAGNSFLNGAKLAAEQISATAYMGKDTKISLVEKDSGSDPARSIQNMNQFIADRSIIATTCCILSGVANSVKPIITGKIPLVIHGATLSGLPSPPWVYSMTVLPGPKDTDTAVKVVEATKPKNAVYFLAGDNDAFKARMEGTRKVLEGMGVQTLDTVSVLTADTDFTAPATQAMGKKPDAIFIYTTQAPAVGIVAALRQRGYTGILVGNDVLAPEPVFKKLGAAVAGIPFPISFSADLTTSETGKAFTTAYKAKFNATPDIYSAQGYQAIWFIAQGLRAAGGKPTRESLSEALAAQKEVEHNVYGGEPIVNGQIETKDTLVVMWSPEGSIVPWKPAK